MSIESLIYSRTPNAEHLLKNGNLDVVYGHAISFKFSGARRGISLFPYLHYRKMKKEEEKECK